MMNIFGKHLISKSGCRTTAYLSQLAAIQQLPMTNINMALLSMRCFSTTPNVIRQFSTQATVQSEGAAHIQQEVEVPIDVETATPA